MQEPNYRVCYMDVVIFSADGSKFWNFIQDLTVSEVQTMEDL